MAQQNALEVRQLRKQLGHKQILKAVTFAAVTGELVAITGANGAGKTTLLRVIAGLARPSGGEVLWNGSSLRLDSRQAAYVSHQPILYGSLTVQENLEFFGRLYGTADPAKLQELLELVGLWLYRLEPAAVLSRGMQQRLAIARALIAEPALILYDEPFTSLDENGREILRQVLENRRPRAVQLLVTHELEHLQGLPFREIRLEEGRSVPKEAAHG